VTWWYLAAAALVLLTIGYALFESSYAGDVLEFAAASASASRGTTCLPTSTKS
jgi:hypothetical protein